MGCLLLIVILNFILFIMTSTSWITIRRQINNNRINHPPDSNETKPELRKRRFPRQLPIALRHSQNTSKRLSIVPNWQWKEHKYTIRSVERTGNIVVGTQ